MAQVDHDLCGGDLCAQITSDIFPTGDLCAQVTCDIFPTGDLCVQITRNIFPTGDLCVQITRDIFPTGDLCAQVTSDIFPTGDLSDLSDLDHDLSYLCRLWFTSRPQTMLSAAVLDRTRRTLNRFGPGEKLKRPCELLCTIYKSLL